MNNIQEIIKLLDSSIKEDANNNIMWWNIIADGYDEVVDDLRSVINNSKDWLINYQNKLIDDTWISKLKIKYTSASWYFIEIPKSQLYKAPNSFIHISTLVNAIRYVTEDLKVFEHKLIQGESELYSREYELYGEIRNKVLDSFKDIKNLSRKVANIDMITSLSNVAYKNNYTRPTIGESYNLEIEWGRHPVIETIERDFISNDLSLKKSNYIDIITWPNMWWKSTFLRQNALIILMAHIWSYVPARKAEIPLTDKIFSRVWAGDNLYLGQSTFMVEMQEMSYILNNTTDRSFIIIDEIWRGTSTYDWMSLAWATLKYIHDVKKSKTLFATHYHELVDESVSLKWVQNYSVAVWENSEWIVFLRKVIKWWIKKSYWLEVAKLAGMNKDILEIAKSMLNKLERENSQLSIWLVDNTKKIEYIKQDSEVENMLKGIDINSLTPIEALNFLNKLKSKI